MEPLYKKNLLFLRQKKGYSQEMMAKELGYSRSIYKEYEYGKQPDSTFLLKMSHYFQLSINDLLEKDLGQIVSESAIDTILLNNGLRVLTITVDEKKKENIEFVPIKAKAGYLNGYSDPQFMVSLKKFSFPLPSIGTFRAFEIEGDSMPPHKNGSIIIGKYVDSWNEIKNLNTYIILTKDEGLVYKRVINKLKEKGFFVLMSDNPIYQPYTQKTESILEVWEYYCHIGFDPKEGTIPVDERLLSKIDEISLEVSQLGSLMRNRLTA
jgi:transcriptional regulator with XRE-family HTH domain